MAKCIPLAICLAKGMRLLLAPLMLGMLYHMLDLLHFDEILGVSYYIIESHVCLFLLQMFSRGKISPISLWTCYHRESIEGKSHGEVQFYQWNNSASLLLDKEKKDAGGDHSIMLPRLTWRGTWSLECYCLERVVRQFNYDQDIPPTPFSNKTNWNKAMQPYIDEATTAMWSGGKTTDNGCPFVCPFMAWRRKNMAKAGLLVKNLGRKQLAMLELKVLKSVPYFGTFLMALQVKLVKLLLQRNQLWARGKVLFIHPKSTAFNEGLGPIPIHGDDKVLSKFEKAKRVEPLAVNMEEALANLEVHQRIMDSEIVVLYPSQLSRVKKAKGKRGVKVSYGTPKMAKKLEIAGTQLKAMILKGKVKAVVGASEEKGKVVIEEISFDSSDSSNDKLSDKDVSKSKVNADKPSMSSMKKVASLNEVEHNDEPSSAPTKSGKDDDFIVRLLKNLEEMNED
ncbi:hypothetical protein SLEP1_g22799 [Rubroshorea leprosula]|uniref:Uncharacterized protein n=1 Tax=Rubroshorea leprosula TaxID=152421 RepID=A0AAV5JGF3_9ROSI|nr:hypothetical protein SLEP1_g22799 [Rubroshorea leprosula]